MILWFRKIIGIVYRNLLKPVLFCFDPEKVHDTFVGIGSFLGKYGVTRILCRKLFYYENVKLEQEVCGMFFKNPVGLSAGFDKDGYLCRILPNVGFGYMEVGSVTLKPYEGNPRPRLFRLKQSSGLVVYYGLKNQGVDKIIARIKAVKSSSFLKGVSIARTNCREAASIESGIEDYYKCLEKLIESDVGDFYVLNISCPNTFSGEPYTEPVRLKLLMKMIDELNLQKPLWVKMPVDLEWNSFRLLLDILVSHRVSAVVIGNLTKNRENNVIVDRIPQHVLGGISGKPMFDLSNELISKTYRAYGDKLRIVGVGGIFSADDAYEKIKRGATLVELITGMIFQGPQVIAEMNEGLVKLLERDGYKNISEAVGAYHREK